MKRDGAQLCYAAQGGCAKFLAQIFEVQDVGTGVQSGTGWQCQISGFMFLAFLWSFRDVFRLGLAFLL